MARLTSRTTRRGSNLDTLEEEEEGGESEEGEAALEEFRSAVAEAERRILEMVRACLC